jgi:hypothetical protein
MVLRKTARKNLAAAGVPARAPAVSSGSAALLGQRSSSVSFRTAFLSLVSRRFKVLGYGIRAMPSDQQNGTPVNVSSYFGATTGDDGERRLLDR